MKYLFFMALSALVLSCQHTGKPSSAIVATASTVDSTPPIAASNLYEGVYKDSISCNYPLPNDYEGNRDTIPKVLEKIEQNGVVFERMSYTRGQDKQPEWYKIKMLDGSCRIKDITGFSHGGYSLGDWDKDGFLDIIEYNSRSPEGFHVHLFDKKTNDFMRLGNYFSEVSWDFDASKGLHAELFDDTHTSNFIQSFRLFQFKDGVVTVISTISFFIDLDTEPFKCTIKVEKGEAEEIAVPVGIFDKLQKQAEVINKLHDDTFNSKKEAWVKEAKAVVEKYWRQKH